MADIVLCVINAMFNLRIAAEVLLVGQFHPADRGGQRRPDSSLTALLQPGVSHKQPVKHDFCGTRKRHHRWIAGRINLLLRCNANLWILGVHLWLDGG